MPKPYNARNSKLQRLHASVRQQGISEDDYRARLERQFGRRSAKDLTDLELEAAVKMFRVKHLFPHMAKVKALFIAAYNLGAFDNGTDAALEAFVKRQTGKDRLNWLTPTEANSVVEALKAICARDGFVVPEGDGMEARKALLRAQWKRLGDLGQTSVRNDFGLDGWVSRYIAGRRESHLTLKRHQLDAANIRLGKWIRRTISGKLEDHGRAAG
jgi:hypothetical protein